MTVKKITLASLILFTLTACSSGGSSNNSNGDLQNQLTQANAKLAESEKAKTKAEQDKLNSEKAKQAVENQLNTAKAELAVAKNNLQQVQSDKTATVEQLKTAQSNLENSEKAKQAVENQLNSAKADLMTAQQNLQKAQADKNTTAEQLKTAQANLTNAENAKQAVENQLNSAKADLSTAQAEKAQAEEALENKKALIKEIVNKAASITEELKWDGAYNWLEFDDSRLSYGLSKHPFVSISNANLDGIFVGNHYVYLTPDVRVIGRDLTAYWMDNKPGQDNFRIQRIIGTRTVELPQSGTFTYTGKGFNADNIGTLNYQVNFSERTGSGKISGFNNGMADIRLEQGLIENGQLKATASANGINGKYELGFYGNQTTSIAGEVYLPRAFEGGIRTNQTAAEKYSDTYETRGTIFGIAGERQ